MRRFCWVVLLVCGCGSAGDAVPDAGTRADVAPQPDAGPAVDLGPEAALDLAADLSTLPPGSFCRGWQDCTGDEVCDLALGVCEKRSSVPASAIEIFTFKPPAAAVGDTLVVDGQRFFVGLFDFLFVQLSIGSTSFAALKLGIDENRILVPVEAAVSGTVKVTGSGATAQSKVALQLAPTGTLPCDGTVPAAGGAVPSDLSQAGPFGAAYVDHPLFKARVYYPAKCGSVRRPASPGTHPLVLLLHGDGAGYLNYEYLAQFLASWGFVSVMPESDNVVELQQIASQMRGVDIGGGAGPMAKGVVTTQQVALVGHSRGAARLQGLVSDSTLKAATVASVFLGPVDDAIVVPGLFMVFGATLDLQSSAAEVDAAYKRQPGPKWKIVIQGGNHSLFTDHKVWLGPFSDAKPTISRTDQFRVVTSFVLPLLERAFAVTEHFPGQIDTPPTSPLYTVEQAK